MKVSKQEIVQLYLPKNNQLSMIKLVWKISKVRNLVNQIGTE